VLVGVAKINLIESSSMSETALSKLLKSFKTAQHDYKINTELFGSLDASKVAKELSLEKIGAEKGSKNVPSASSQIPDEIESQISERIDAARIKANEIAENQIQTYSDRISNLDFEGHFSELRQVGPLVVNEIQTETQNSLNIMNIRRKKYLEVEKEYNYFRSKNGLENRTAKLSLPSHNSLRVLVLVLMIVVETLLNGSFLAKNNSEGILGGSLDAFTFAFINIGFSVLLTIFVIKQIHRPRFIYKIIGLIGIIAWLSVVVTINLGLAHFRETSGAFLEGAGNQVVQLLIEQPFNLQELKSWVLFGVGTLFAAITLADVISFTDIFPGYTKLQEKWDKEQDEYKAEFEDLLDNITNIKDEYHNNLNSIGADLTIRQQELDKIIAGRNRLIALYNSNNEQLQRAADVMFSAYYEANRSKRSKAAPKRYDAQFKVKLIQLSSGENFSSTETKKIKKKIAEAKNLLDDQISEVLSEVTSAITQLRNLDELNISHSGKQNG
tara:strand:+ start:517 stop:2010 length:1494 start_codon:yes stop_codon:yes gene_type:complete